MPEPLTIVVSGHVVANPIAGLSWVTLNYLIGLQELGHEVWFFEDLACNPYHPLTRQTVVDTSYARDSLRDALARCERPVGHCVYSEWEGRWHGLERDGLESLLRRADLLIAVGAVMPMRDERPRARRMIAIDLDPVYTQTRMLHDPGFVDYFRKFDAVATYGPLIGTASCQLPTLGFDWIPTRQPIALSQWPFSEPHDSTTFTTLCSWGEPGRSFELDGKLYRCAKGPEFAKFVELPQRAPWTLSIAVETSAADEAVLFSMPPDDQARFRQAGWILDDPFPPSRSVSSYQEFIRGAAGEFTAAKEQYVAVPTGWFSDRSACFLASGRPVVTQATAFERWLPTGEGLFSFATIDEAVSALSAIKADHVKHARAARRIAEEYFDARRVLAALIERVL
jgi:hypothetical protein